jgi:integrase
MLCEYQLTAIDGIVIRVARKADISRKITNHTLRRTCGRLFYKVGVDIAEIADILDILKLGLLRDT